MKSPFPYLRSDKKSSSPWSHQKSPEHPLGMFRKHYLEAMKFLRAIQILPFIGDGTQVLPNFQRGHSDFAKY